ncbi:hypothetical protein HGA88_00200 [Candidatus Roizmanbacteria bacterium]|nr:hypothetical protein [Candidatus Roizmanbacteria bacterium]
MQTPQIQLKLSLSSQLNHLLKEKSDALGVPVTQYVKYIIIKEIEKDQFPTYQASELLEKKTKKALQEMKKSVSVHNVDTFFESL